MRIGKFEIAWGKRLKDIVSKSANTTWGKLWETVRENSLFQNKVTKPYEQVCNVYKAVKAIADNVAQAEIGIYDDATNEEIENLDPDLERILFRPNKKQSYTAFFQEIGGFYALYGEAFILKVSSVGNMAGTTSLPAELRVLDPKLMNEVIDNSTGELTGWRYAKATFKTEEIIHIKDFNPYNRYRGMPPTLPSNKEIEIDYETLVYNKAFFDNDATPDFVLTTDKTLTDVQIKRFTEFMEKRNKGAVNAHKMNVFDGGIKPSVLSSTHKDMDFIEQKKYMREELLGVWKTPKALFNITEDLNYATFIGQMKIFWIYTIIPILRKVEEQINMELIFPFDPTVYFAFNIQNVPAFQEDFKEKVTTAYQLWQMGFTGNEINQKLNLGFDEQDWRDFWWINFGQVPADVASAQDARNQVTNQNNQDNQGKSLPQTAKDKQAECQDGKLSIDKDLNALYLWKEFLIKQVPLEKRFESKMKRYFFEQRKKILSALTDHNKHQLDSIINWGAEDDELKKWTAPIISKCVESGVDLAKGELKTKSIAEDIFLNKLQAYIATRIAKIIGINRTTQKRLRSKIDEGVQAGETIDQIADRVRDYYNMSGSRAKLIARTETAGGVNGGTQLYYEDIGVEKKKWLTAGDEAVRPTHRVLDGEVVDIDERFSNGLMYPADSEGEAGEVINCRCREVAVID